MHVTIEDLAERLSFNDLMEMHEVLNVLEDAEAEANRG